MFIDSSHRALPTPAAKATPPHCLNLASWKLRFPEIALRNRLAATALLLPLLGGCASMLPKASQETANGWHTFEEAKRAYDSIVPGKTKITDLQKIGYTPYEHANVTVMNYTDVAARFAPVGMREELLDPGIKNCLAARDLCYAYKLDHQIIKRDRVGNFLLDFTNFKRRTEITGWRFNAIVVLINDVVVHKVWGGQPTVNEVEETRNPLGPLQSIGESNAPYRR